MSLIDRARSSPRISRIVFNCWPCIRGTGSRVTYIAPDWSEVRVRLGLGWRTRNYVGTIFGGAMYAAVDPYYMIMLIQRLGPDFVVWDKAASIRFRRPGRTRLTGTFRIDDEELAALRRDVEQAGGSLDRTYSVDLVDADGVVHASIDKVLYVATKAAWRDKQQRRTEQR